MSEPIEKASNRDHSISESVSGTKFSGIQRHLPLSRKTLQSLFLRPYQPADPIRMQWSRMIDTMVRLQRAQMAWSWDLVSELYEPFDPDAIDPIELHPTSTDDRSNRQEIFLHQFEDAIRRANFQKIEFDTVQHAVRTKNDQRINTSPIFRSSTKFGSMAAAHAWSSVPKVVAQRFQIEMKNHAGWHWLIVLVKFKEGMDLGPLIKPNKIYLRLFKDVAFRELEMHLPEQATRMKMPILDRVQIASPVFIGLPTIALKIAMAASWLNPLVLGAVLTGSVSSGWKSFAGFRNAKLKHTHQMISNLFYLTLANNRQCITRVMEMASEQESMESLLAQRILWEADQNGETLDADQLDVRVEDFLRVNGNLEVDFQNQDAIQKLERLGLIKRNGIHLKTLTLEESQQVLQNQWHALMP